MDKQMFLGHTGGRWGQILIAVRTQALAHDLMVIKLFLKNWFNFQYSSDQSSEPECTALKPEPTDQKSCFSITVIRNTILYNTPDGHLNCFVRLLCKNQHQNF